MSLKIVSVLLTLISMLTFVAVMWFMFHSTHPSYWIAPAFIWGFNLGSIGAYTLINWRNL